ncbi:MAG: TonB-dependent receptor [Pseudomonadota bacterium]
MDKASLMRGVALATISFQLFCVPNASLAQSERIDIDDDDIIITTGTRRSARSAANTPAPIDVIGSDEVLNQGDTDLLNILRNSVPSFNVNTQPITVAATLVRPANLRGLSPDNTLVLLNGKRRHRSAIITRFGGGISDGAHGPDVSVIPAIALKQIEVLRDGAASQYGSDAIAGVINFVLRDDADGAIFEAEYGQTYQGDGDQYSLSANVGLPINIGQGGFMNISAEYGETDGTIRSVQRSDVLGLNEAGNTAVTDLSVNTVTTDVTQIWGQPEVNDDYTIFANAAIPFSEQIEFYTFGNYAERQVEGSFFFRNPNNRSGIFSNDGGETLLVGDLTANGSGACPTINVTNNVPDPVTLAQVSADPNCFVFNEILPGGFVPRFGGNLEDSSVVVGLRGELPMGTGLTYDVSYTYGQNEADFFINNTVNASLGPDTPRDFDPGTYRQSDDNFNVDFAYGLANNLFASDIGLALGFEHRAETFEIIVGEPASSAIGPLASQGFSSSSNGFGGFTASQAGEFVQKNYAVYFDTETDITEDLVFQGAVRYEDFYTSFGGTLNYKLGALYRVNDWLRLRSTYSTGFRAPTSGQQNFSAVNTALSGGLLQDSGTVPLTSAAGQLVADALGIDTALSPEESKNFSVGFASNLGGIDLTVDYFNIRTEGRISIGDDQDFFGLLVATADANGIALPTNPTTFQALTALDAGGILNLSDFAGSEDLVRFNFFTNAFSTRTQGIDVVASKNFQIYNGSSTIAALAFNWTDTNVTDAGRDTPAPLSLGRQEELEDNLPATRGSLTLNHFDGPFRGLVRLNYWGSYFECYLGDTGDNSLPRGCGSPIEVGDDVTVDLEAAYTLKERVQLIAGAQNVFDTVPVENPFANRFGGQFPTTSPFGFSGGYYYFKVRAEF